MRFAWCIFSVVLISCRESTIPADKIIYGESFNVDGITLQTRMYASFVEGNKAWTVAELTDKALVQSQSNAFAALAKNVKNPETYNIKEISLQSVSGRLVLFIIYAKSKLNGLEQEVAIPVNSKYETLSPQP